VTGGEAVPIVQRIGPGRLTAGFERYPRLDLRAHQSIHGGLRQLSLQELVELAQGIRLRGRGGAGFPFVRKLRAVVDAARVRDAERVVVVNATEGEPASWKDKVLLARAPHLVLDGAAVTAAALRAAEIVIGVAAGESDLDSLVAALAERRMPVPTRVVTMPARFISGESGALVRGANGEIPIPPGRKVRASESGVDGLPTLLSNAETYAQLALAARLGVGGYAQVGTARQPGTVLLSVGGSARYPSVVEAPAGVLLTEVLRLCRANLGPGVLIGGYHGAWLARPVAKQVELSWDGLVAAGGTFGAGIVLPLGEGTCPLGEAARVVRYLAGQSAGQCGPCRLGLPDLAGAVAALADGSGGAGALDTIRAAAGAVRGRGACSHPDGTARFALSTVEAFPVDVAAHLDHDGCGQGVRGVLPLPPAQGDHGRRLAVDWARCDGHGLCAHALPELIRLDGNGFPSFPDASVPTWLEPGARKAVNVCPALALRLTRSGRPARGSRR